MPISDYLNMINADLLLPIILVLSALGAALFFFGIITLWHLFERAFVAGWRSLIPVYSGIVCYKLFWRPVWYFVTLIIGLAIFVMEIVLLLSSHLYLIPSISLIILWIAFIVLRLVFSFKLSYAFAKSRAYALGLFFLPMIFYPMLAFGKSVYIGK